MNLTIIIGETLLAISLLSGNPKSILSAPYQIPQEKPKQNNSDIIYLREEYRLKRKERYVKENKNYEK